MVSSRSIRGLGVALVMALVLAVVGAAPAVAAEATRTLRVELNAPASGPFAVENLAGTMRIAPGSGSKVVAIATVHAESEELAATMKFEQVPGKGGTPTLRVRYPLDQHTTFRYPGKGEHDSAISRWFGSHSNSTADYDGQSVRVSTSSGVLLYADVEVQVPSGSIEAVFKNVVGDLDARDLKGTIKFDTSNGDQKIEKISGTIIADTGSGDVKASAMEGTLKVDTGSGDVLVEDFRGDKLSCDTGSGDVVVKTGAARLVNVDTGSGDVKADDIDAEEFIADTGSGDVTFEAGGARLKRLKADTGSGDVVLRLGPDASFEALADQGSGDIENRYPDAQPIVKGKEVIGYRRGDGHIRITVDTGSGDLTLDPGGRSARKSGV